MYSRKNTPAQRGRLAEELACRYLQRQGLRLLARNYRCRYGELDLIMRDGDTLVFVEVRYRSRQDFGGSVASIGYAKRRRLATTALHYLQHSGNSDRVSRFDIVALDRQAQEADITWLRDAFSTTA